ncbi:hypothetical protein [Helicovermis profundi]|uniref:Uncharacterized protein n=1 Tax=Helicovermis profundi TaxID=3065157 RepID=A0AAU9EIN1_9FIRM|nr:hypothetical protein HLPR_00800 [Clostridia bacterium S502]
MKPYLLFENGTKIALSKKINKNILGKLVLKGSKILLNSFDDKDSLELNIKNKELSSNVNFKNTPIAKYIIDNLGEEYHLYDIKTYV